MKITLSKAQWRNIGKKAGWIKNDDWRSNEEVPYAELIMRYPKTDIVRAIKRLGEESIAGFSNIKEDDVDDILMSLEKYELSEILECLKKPNVN